MKKRMLAFLISMGMVLAGIAPAMPLAAQAGQAEEEAEGVVTTGVAEMTPGESTPGETQVEKKLLQDDGEWTILQYIDNTGSPMFDVRYLEKTRPEFEKDGLLLQYRTIYRNDDEFELRTSSWNDLDTAVSEEIKSDMERNKTKYFI